MSRSPKAKPRFSFTDVFGGSSATFELGGHEFALRPLSIAEAMALADIDGKTMLEQLDTIAPVLASRLAPGSSTPVAITGEWLAQRLTTESAATFISILGTGRLPASAGGDNPNA